ALSRFNWNKKQNVEIICIFLQICLKEIDEITQLTILIFAHFVGIYSLKTINFDSFLRVLSL
ncbi:hypothetical protein ACFMJW_09920, partial [Acinetobacter baumannii]